MRRHLMIAAALVLAAGCSAPPPPAEPPRPVVDFGGFGPFHIGMTLAEVRAANAGNLKESGLASSCVSFVDTTATSDQAGALRLLVTPDGRLAGIHPPITARTVKGIGIGSTHAETEAAYAGFLLTEDDAEAGHVVLIQKPNTNDYLGFTFTNTSVVSTAIGVHDFAAGYELCSG